MLLAVGTDISRPRRQDKTDTEKSPEKETELAITRNVKSKPY